MCDFVSRRYDESQWQFQEETVPPHSKNVSSYTDRSYYIKDRNVSVLNTKTAGRIGSSDKRHTVPSSKLVSVKRNREFLYGGETAMHGQQSAAGEKYRKRPHSSSSFEKVPAKLQCTTERVGKCREDTGVNAAGQRKPVANEMSAVAGNVEETLPPKRKRPAENLTLGTLFDLASHLDAARKNTRRDFDPDSVTVVRQSKEGSHLLHMRPEFNGIETSASSSADKLVESNVDTSPLSLCHTDNDSAVRLGSLIAETIDQHVDLKKLEQTAKSVSQRLQHGTTKTYERKIVCRPQPVLISTVPRPASGTGDKVLQTNNNTKCTPKVSGDGHPTSHVAAKYHQHKLFSPNSVQPRLTSVSPRFGNRQGTVNTGRGRQFRAADNVKSSYVPRLIPTSTDGPLKGSGDAQSVQRIVGGKKTNAQSQLPPDNLSHDGDSKLKEDKRYIGLIIVY